MSKAVCLFIPIPVFHRSRIMHFPESTRMKSKFLLYHNYSYFMNDGPDGLSLSSQKSCESNTCLATSAGHHLHALLCESGGGWHLTNRFHLFQLLFTVFSGENKHNDIVWHVTALENPMRTVFRVNNVNHTDFVMRLIVEKYDFFREDFSGYEPFCGKMIWSSILAVLTYNMAPLPLCFQD